MPKLKDILYQRELEMIEHYRWIILTTDIEGSNKLQLYQNEISRIIETAKKRYYESHPTLTPMKKDNKKETSTPSNQIRIRELLTEEETEEVDFLLWRLTKTFTPWGRNKINKKIETIYSEVERRYKSMP